MNESSQSIYECINSVIKKSPDKKLIGDSSRWLTATEAKNIIFSMGKQLIACGIKPNDNIAIHATRTLDTVLAMFAIRMAGAVALLTDPHKTPEQFLAECSVPIPFHAVLMQQSEGCFLLRRGTETHSILIDKNDSQIPEDIFTIDGNTPAFIIFTSGTCGKTKPVVLSELSLITTLLDSDPYGGYSFDDIALGAIPFEHVFGLVLAVGIFVHGYSLFVPERTDISALLDTIAKEKITRMNGVPSLYQAMAENCSSYDLSSLRVGFIGGAPISKDIFIEIENALGMTLVPVYGMSECIGISVGDCREPSELRCENVGKYYKRNTVHIYLENGKEAAPMQEGEICVNGPYRMLGYWPDLMPKEMLLKTGDLGYVDNNGYLVISGRKKEIIIRNGKNLSPKKIEDALLSLPGVSHACVVGLPDEKAGEAPYAMVVGIVDPADLKKILQKNELPVGIMCVESLPLTSSGKPDKQNIKEVLSAWKNG